MKKTILFILVIALLSVSCEALFRKQKQVGLRALAEVTQDVNADSLSLDDLLSFQVESSIDCSESQQYLAIKSRIQGFITFFSNDPQKKLQDSISSLGQASLLLKKAKQIVEKAQRSFSLAQSRKNKGKSHQDKLEVLGYLNSAEAIVNPELFNKLIKLIQSNDPSAKPDSVLHKLDEAINLIQIIKKQYQDLLNISDYFGSYRDELNQKVSDIDSAVQSCS